MKVAEFRTNLRACLDRAAKGEVIIIERGGLEFFLRTKPTSIKLPESRQEYPTTPQEAEAVDQSQLKKRSFNGPAKK